MGWIQNMEDAPDLQPQEPPPPSSPAMRVLRFPLTILIIGTALWVAAQFLGAIFRSSLSPATKDIAPYLGHWTDLPYGVAVTIFAVLAYWLLKKVEGEPLYDFAPYKWSRELTGGLIIGTGLMAIITGFVWMMEHYRIAGWGNAGFMGLAAMLGLALSSGVAEEILFRGIFFRLTEKMMGSWFALAFSAGLFGYLHIGNANATWFSSAAIAVEAGIMLGALYMLTRRLWAVIGLHAAWNFTQGYIFGIPVSGMKTPSLVQSTLSGSDWMTGGAFGLEASVPALIVATAAGLAILRLAIMRGQLKHPMWAKKNRQELPPVNPII